MQLILGMAADLHAQPVSTAVSASVTRLAAAIRMVSLGEIRSLAFSDLPA
jgi:hypothetical protein